MIKLASIILFFTFSVVAKEGFFYCKSDGPVENATVFVEVEIFCQDNRTNPATLVLLKEGKTKDLKGSLFRWKSGKGETFQYETGEENITLHLPYGISTGILARIENEEIIESIELRCVTKQILANCD